MSWLVLFYVFHSLVALAGFIMIIGGVYSLSRGIIKLNEVAANVSNTTEVEIKNFFRFNSMYPTLVYFTLGLLAMGWAAWNFIPRQVEITGEITNVSNPKNIVVKAYEEGGFCKIEENKFLCLLQLTPSSLNLNFSISGTTRSLDKFIQNFHGQREFDAGSIDLGVLEAGMIAEVEYPQKKEIEALPSNVFIKSIY